MGELGSDGFAVSNVSRRGLLRGMAGGGALILAAQFAVIARPGNTTSWP